MLKDSLSSCNGSLGAGHVHSWEQNLRAKVPPLLPPLPRRSPHFVSAELLFLPFFKNIFLTRSPELNINTARVVSSFPKQHFGLQPLSNAPVEKLSLGKWTHALKSGEKEARHNKTHKLCSGPVSSGSGSVRASLRKTGEALRWSWSLRCAKRMGCEERGFGLKCPLLHPGSCLY